MAGHRLADPAVLAAIAGPYLWGINPFTQNLMTRLQPPVWLGGTDAHPLGTDQLGRDYLARLLYGARISLGIGLFAAMTSGLIGTTLGSSAASSAGAPTTW